MTNREQRLQKLLDKLVWCKYDAEVHSKIPLDGLVLLSDDFFPGKKQLNYILVGDTTSLTYRPVSVYGSFKIREFAYLPGFEPQDDDKDKYKYVAKVLPPAHIAGTTGWDLKDQGGPFVSWTKASKKEKSAKTDS